MGIKNIYEPNICIGSEGSSLRVGSNFKIPAAEYVILRDSFGNKIHRYGDDIINLSLISINAKCNQIDFTHLPNHLREEGRWMWFLAYFNGKGVNKNTLSVNTLYKYFYSFVRPLALFADSINTTMTNILGDKKLLSKYIYMHQRESHLKASQGMLSLYINLGFENIGFTVAYDAHLRNYVNQKVNDWKYKREQVPVIPPRIYQERARLMWSVIDELELHIGGIEKLISILIDEPSVRAERVNHGNLVDWEETRKSRLCSIINECGLKSFLEKHQCENRVHITSLLTAIQSLCKELIHLYSGMRDNEVLQLDYHCLNVESSKLRPKARIIGNTTKYVGNKKTEQWITSSDIERVINILKAMARPIARKIGLSLVPRSSNICPLFISMVYLSRFNSTKKKHPLGKRADASNIRLTKRLVRLNQIEIEEEDLVFLERLDPERDWRANKKFEIGNVWRFTSHQYRRSLAVYAAQSGLVSLGSLQTQLKHLLREVTFYYSNGAENLGGLFEIGNSHVASLYKSQKALADFTAYIIDVLFSEEPLLGAAGIFADKQRDTTKETDYKNNILLENRANTIKRFKQGAMAYKTTALGGCISTKKCNSYLTKSFLSCLNCESAVIKPSKLKRGISVLKNYLSNADSGSVECRTEQYEYDELTRFAAKKDIKI